MALNYGKTTNSLNFNKPKFSVAPMLDGMDFAIFNKEKQ